MKWVFDVGHVPISLYGRWRIDCFDKCENSVYTKISFLGIVQSAQLHNTPICRLASTLICQQEVNNDVYVGLVKCCSIRRGFVWSNNVTPSQSDFS